MKRLRKGPREKILQRNRYVLNSDQDVEDDDFVEKKKRKIFRKKKMLAKKAPARV